LPQLGWRSHVGDAARTHAPETGCASPWGRTRPNVFGMPRTQFLSPAICYITQTWRSRPLTDRLAVELIAATSRVCSTGGPYRKGIKVRAAEMKTLDITGDPFHPEWNPTSRHVQLQIVAVNMAVVLRETVICTASRSLARLRDSVGTTDIRASLSDNSSVRGYAYS
jgi:hypothetical protein